MNLWPPGILVAAYAIGVAFGAWYVGHYRAGSLRSDEEWNDLCAVRQREAYQLGLEQGRAVGELQGAAQAFGQLEVQIRERDGWYGEMTLQDVERAKRGMVH